LKFIVIAVAEKANEIDLKARSVNAVKRFATGFENFVEQANWL
jgi:hypothetical protein